MYGKTKCKILKEIRRRIAAENEIPFVTKECTYQGSCRGTCPRCEEELRYLERQLEKRQRLGKTVAVSALSVSLLAGSAACEPLFGEKPVDQLEGDVPYYSETQPSDFGDSEGAPLEEETEPVKGELEYPETSEDLLVGEVYDTTEEQILEGDVAYVVVPTEETEELLLGMVAYTGSESSEPESEDE